MKFKNLLYFAAVVLFIQCSPKAGEQMAEQTPSTDQSWRSQSPDAGPARQINMGEYNVFDMENGLKVIVVENHKLPRVSYQLSLLHNPVLEKEQAGFLSLTGDLLGRGTTNRTKAQIDEEIDFIGASFNTSSSGIFGSSLTKHQAAMLDVMTDVLYNPVFPEEEFDKIKTQTLSGLQASKTDPNSIASNVASVVNYSKDHPYGEVVTEETVNNIKMDRVKKYYNTYFKPNNAYLTIVGDITLEEAKKKAQKYFGKWKKGNVPENNYDIPERPSEAKVCVANKDGAVQSVIRITYPIELKPGSHDAEKASLMNSILGGGVFSGRLMQNLREDKAFTYGARSSTSSDRLVGTFNASASVRNEVTDSSVHEFIYEMERMRTEPVSEEDITISKNSLAGSFARSLESPQTLARYAQNIVRYDLPEDHYEKYLERLEAITIEDIQETAQKYILPGQANIVVVGNKDEIAESLVKFDGDGEIDYYDAFGNKLEMNDSALPADVNADVVLNDYYNAIGGKEKLGMVKTMEMHYGMDLMGQKLSVNMYKKSPNKFAMKIGNDQMVMQEMKFDGTTAFAGGMGGNQKATEGPVFDQAKAQAVMFEQMEYDKEGYTIELKGIDNVDGEAAYKMSVTNPDGDTVTEYYSVKTNLLLRQVSVQEGAPGQSVTITNDYKDYKEVGGIKLPYTIVTTGAMPVPLEMKAKEIKINEGIDDTKFIIE